MRRLIFGFVAGALAAVIAIWMWPRSPGVNQVAVEQHECFSRGALQPEEIVAACSALLAGKKASQETAKLFFARGQAFADLNESQKAIEDLNKAIQGDAALAPQANTLIGQINAKAADIESAKNNLAVQLKPDNAPALSIDPKDRTAYRQRGNIYSQKMDYKNALADFDKAIDLDPDHDATVYNDRGQARYNLRNFDGAIADFRKATEIDPGYAEAFNNMGAAFNEKGDPNAALAPLNRAIELNARLGKAYNNRAFSSAQLKAYGPALTDLDEVIARDPQNAIALGNRCWVRAVLNQLSEALVDCQQAALLDPKRTAIFDNMGLIALKSGRYGDAISNYNRVIDVTSNAASLYGRGYAKQKSGNAEGNLDIDNARTMDAQIAAYFTGLLNSPAPQPGSPGR
jgi:tetratricopeptide (TPR) repeat protein